MEGASARAAASSRCFEPQVETRRHTETLPCAPEQGPLPPSPENCGQRQPERGTCLRYPRPRVEGVRTQATHLRQRTSGADAAQDEERAVVQLAAARSTPQSSIQSAVALRVHDALLGLPLPRARLLEQRVRGPARLRA